MKYLFLFSVLLFACGKEENPELPCNCYTEHEIMNGSIGGVVQWLPMYHTNETIEPCFTAEQWELYMKNGGNWRKRRACN
jgi:hypothetical protein